MNHGWKCLIPFLLSVALAASGVSALAQEVRKMVYSTEAENLFERGLEAYGKGTYEKALDFFERLLEFPLNQRSSAAQLMASQTSFKLERYDAALAAAKLLQRRFGNSRYIADARLVSGDAYYILGRYYEAATQYGRILATPAPLELQASAAERLAGIAQNGHITPNALETIRLRIGADRLRDALLYGKARWYDRLEWEPQSRMAMQAYLDSVDGGIFAAMAHRNLKGVDAEPAVSSPALAGPSASPPPKYIDGKQLPRLGLLIPLSGPDRHYGEDLLDGVRLANEEAGEPFEIVVGDLGHEYGDLPIEEREGSKLLRAVHAARQLIEEERVLAIIGPVFSSTSVAASVVAEAAGVPLLVPLAQQSGLDLLGSNIFQLSIVPEIQGQALAEYATLVLGLQNLVILTPLSDYGRSFKGAFVDSARANGAEIVYEDWYVPYETRDFSFFFKEVRRVGFELIPPPPEDALALDDSLLWLDGDSTSYLEEADSLARLEEEETPPDSSEIFIDTIDAVVIVVETFEDAKTIAPQLSFHRLETQILGNDLWHAPEELREVRRVDRKYFTGSIFVARTHDQVQATRKFIDAFRRRFGREPLHAAHSYDAARLVMAGFERGERSRTALRQWLGEVQDFGGASGTISFAPGRGVNTDLDLVKIDNGLKMIPLRFEDLPELKEIEEVVEDLDLPEMEIEMSDAETELDE